MKLVSHAIKPRFNSSHPPLCQFSIEKAYLWSLIRDKLTRLSESSPKPLSVLDAACHSLITRGMFPQSFDYYGIDISLSRLKVAFKQKQPCDTLYLGDLTLPLGLTSCFDVVVSCNTLSHLPSAYLSDALANLIDSVKSNGDLIVNIGLSRDHQSVASALLDSFESVETVYLGTKKSREIDSKKNFRPADIPYLISRYEDSVPNNACIHSQVLFFASTKKPVSNEQKPPGSSAKILILNTIPSAKVHTFSSDVELLSSFLVEPTYDLILFSDLLYNSPYGSSMVSSLSHLSSKIYSLSSANLPLEPGLNVCFIGFEISWLGDQAKSRLIVNTIRRIPNVSLNFLLVQHRNDVKCSPSLIVDDL